MLATKQYNRSHAQEYAQRWALSRNPLFYNFIGIGGDCTNFISQCVYAGSCAMNYKKDLGWYYNSQADRAPAWTSVQYFYQFITKNKGPGPFAKEAEAKDMQIGDVIQLGNEAGSFYHNLLITGIEKDTFLVCAHTNDALNRRLDTYLYTKSRYLHIEGVRMYVPGERNCFSSLINGRGF